MSPIPSHDEPYPFDWGALVPRLVHPLKVVIVEALSYIDEPLSASDLRLVFGEQYDLSLISYHVVGLAKVGALAKVRQQQVRGALKTFYFFPPPR